MPPPTWSRIKAVFEEASECPPERLDAFLVQRCADDEDLLREVRSLLNASEKTGLIDTPVQELIVMPDINAENAPTRFDTGDGPSRPASGKPETDSLIDRQIGNYRIVKIIGQGGMGAVYKAVRADKSFQQEAALKIVPREAANRDLVRRFRTERQILANLDHPNIGKLLDGGTTEEGLPYFVMEFIEGVPITEYCDAKRLSIFQRLELFRTVCSAVQYAHKNLVVHRDLKPSNILVTRDGVVKLLDFGIAKVLAPLEFSLEAAEATEVGTRVLTPKYAAPEQVRGENVTTACDVYCLGVLLYELLTGHMPYRFNSLSASEIDRVIQTVEPDKPSLVVVRAGRSSVAARPGGENTASRDELRRTVLEKSAGNRNATPEKLRRQLAGDLDLILLTCLRKEPEHRYPSVEKLSDDLLAFLDGRPVSARSDLGYRARKFIRRNKYGLAAAALVVLLMIVGTVVSIQLALIARTEREKAETRFLQGRKLAETLLGEFHNSIRSQPGMTPSREKIIKEGLKYLDNMAAEKSDDPRLMHDTAMGYLLLGDVLGQPYTANLGDTEGALRSYEKSRKILEALHAEHPASPEFRRDLSVVLERIGDAAARNGDSNQAMPLFQRALEIRASLSNAEPDNAEYRKLIADCRARIGDGLRSQGDYKGALEAYQTVIDIRQSLADNAGVPDAQRGVATTYHRLGETYRQIGDFIRDTLADPDGTRAFYKRSLEAHRRTLAITEELLAPDPTNAFKQIDVAGASGDTALLLAQTGDRVAAETLFRKAMTMHEKLSSDDPKNNELRLQLAYVHRHLGDFLFHSGNAEQALNHFRNAQILYEKTATADSKNIQAYSELAGVQDPIGSVLMKTGRVNEAVVSKRSALESLERLCREYPTNANLDEVRCRILINFCRLLVAAGQTNEARRLTANELAARQRRIEASGNPSISEMKRLAGLLLTCEPTDLRNPAGALEYAKRAVAMTREQDPTALYALAAAYSALGNPALAVRTREKAIALMPISNGKP